MQVLWCLAVVLVCVQCQQPGKIPAEIVCEESSGCYRSKPAIRVIPADVLRDFPGSCFGSTLCRTFNVSDSWSLAPFCGISTCTKQTDPQTGQEFLLEEVRDCGPRPQVVPQAPNADIKPCPLYVEAFNATAIFPACCPVFQCIEGYALQFPKLGDQKV